MTADEVLRWLERHGTKGNREGLVRYGIVAPRAFGVPVGAMLRFAKGVGKDHALAAALWESGWYEARMLAGVVGPTLFPGGREACVSGQPTPAGATAPGLPADPVAPPRAEGKRSR